MNLQDMSFYEEKIGPVVHVPPSQLICSHCKYFRRRLKISGRNPVYDFFCEHPKMKEPVTMPQAEIDSLKVLLKEHLIPKTEASYAERSQLRAEQGVWIGNKIQTPQWCPVIKK